MTLVRWDPFRDLVGIQERLNRLLVDSAPRQAGDEGYGAWVPPVDIFERGDDLVIRAEVPGVDRADIDVRVENGVLQIRGERKSDTEIHEKTAYRLERVYGLFTRSFTLPTSVDPSRISAKYRDGVLEVALPKVEAAKPKRVQIEAA
jgi:HSP20 family protein